MSESLFDRAIELIKTSSKPLSETELSNALQCTTADIRALQPSISSNLNIICKSVTDAKLDYVLADTTDETNLRLQLIAIDKQQRAEIESLLRQKSELEAKKNRHIKFVSFDDRSLTKRSGCCMTTMKQKMLLSRYLAS